MIRVTRFNGKIFYINAELIKTIEAFPDTVVTLIDGTKLVVSEPAEEVSKKIVHYKQLSNQPPKFEEDLGD